MLRWLVCIALLALGTKSAAGDPGDSAGEQSFTVLSNNVGIFPKEITALYPAKLREKKQAILADEEARAAELAQALLKFSGDPDAILLQEIWSLKARDVVIRELRTKYPSSKSPETVAAAEIPILPSGLMLFSKYPLEQFQFQEFTKGMGIDKISRKGIIGARLVKGGRKIALFTTHLQAGAKRDPGIKPDQLRECREFMGHVVGSDKDVTVILAGDFNIDASEPAAYAELFAQLRGARDSFRSSPGTLNRTVRAEANPNKRLDYLFTFDGVEAVSEVVDPAGKRVSDHLAIFGKVSLADRGAE